MARADSKKKTSSRKKTTVPKVHPCHICFRIFARATDVKRHLNAVHYLIKDFKCSFCGREFAQKGGMKTHMNIHTGARPYKCRVLGCNHRRFSDPSSRSRHEFETHAPPSFECPEGCAAFKRKDALKAHVKDRHPHNIYPESAFANKMTRERFNAEFLNGNLDVDEYATSSPSGSAQGRKEKTTSRKGKRASTKHEEEEEEEDDAETSEGSWSSQSSDTDMSSRESSCEPTRRSGRLAKRPLISMKEETPEWSRAPTPASMQHFVHPPSTPSRHATPVLASPFGSPLPSRVPTPAIRQSSRVGTPVSHPRSRVPTPVTPFQGTGVQYILPGTGSRIGTPSLAVPAFHHHAYTPHTSSPLGSRSHSPSQPTNPDMLVSHLANDASHITPPMADPFPNIPSPLIQFSQPATPAAMPLSTSGSLMGLGLTDVDLSLPLSSYFDSPVIGGSTQPLPSSDNQLGLQLSGGAGPSGSFFGNYSMNGTINPMDLHTPPPPASAQSSSYFLGFAHTSLQSPFNPSQSSPAATAFNPSPVTPAGASRSDLDQDFQSMFASPERPLMRMDTEIDFSTFGSPFFGSS